MESNPNEQLPIRDRLKDAQMKIVMKEAVNEWLEEKFALLSKWTLGGIAALTLALLAYTLIEFAHWRHL